MAPSFCRERRDVNSRGKFQAPTSRLQRSSRHQIPIDGGRSFGVWYLEFLGKFVAWSLELQYERGGSPAIP